MENTFFNTFVVVFKSSPWSQATDGTLYTKDDAEAFVKKEETTTPTFAGCRLESLQVITLDEFIDNCKERQRQEGYDSGHEAGYTQAQDMM